MSSKNAIRVGKVSSVNYDLGTVKVVFEDQDDIVSQDMPMLAFEYNMPTVGAFVLCIYHKNGQGFCLGTYYNQKLKPIEKSNYYKNILNEAFFRYEKESKTLTINAQNIVLEGNIKILGNLNIEGNLQVDGTILS
jgi:phage baseplate assembly protein gpV